MKVVPSINWNKVINNSNRTLNGYIFYAARKTEILKNINVNYKFIYKIILNFLQLLYVSFRKIRKILSTVFL